MSVSARAFPAGFNRSPATAVPIPNKDAVSPPCIASLSTCDCSLGVESTKCPEELVAPIAAPGRAKFAALVRPFSTSPASVGAAVRILGDKAAAPVKARASPPNLPAPPAQGLLFNAVSSCCDLSPAACLYIAPEEEGPTSPAIPILFK